MHYERGQGESTTIDVHPILMLCKDAPDLIIRCGLHHCPCCLPRPWAGGGFTATLLACSTNAKLATLISEAFVAIELHYSTIKKLVVKKGHWEDWMLRFDDELYWRFEKMPENMKVSYKNLGLPVEWWGQGLEFARPE
jgi:hypothetical protein